MANKKRNVLGMKFDRLTVIEEYGKNERGQFLWKCICSCNNLNIKIATSSDLIRGFVSSCGCKQKENKSGEKNKKYNDFLIIEDYVILYTFKREEIIVDLQDFDKVKNFCWHLDRKEYPCCTFDGKRLTIFELILEGIPKGMIDHIDRDPKNNRRNNLRPATLSQQGANQGLRKTNKSGIIGVFYRKEKDRWEPHLQIEYDNIYLGVYYNFKDAVVARLKAEKEYFGEFAPQKHLFKEYGIE